MSGIDGYTKKILRVDLTKKKIIEEKVDEATLRKYLGGTGIGVKFLYDEVAPEVEWSDVIACLENNKSGMIALGDQESHMNPPSGAGLGTAPAVPLLIGGAFVGIALAYL